MKALKVGNAIACEYVSIGANGKPIIVHSYVGDILVQQLPAVFPLAFYFELTPDSNGPTKIRVFQGEKLRAEMEIEFEDPTRLGLLHIPAAIFTIDQNTDVRVVASAEGMEDVTLLTKQITLGQIPS